ncbi:MAG: PUA domain-containing protein [Candidatus Thermoplasmatota archaeon]|nr:PUA domain-containing protein [Candidatus Thermoplasmatota archaeon]
MSELKLKGRHPLKEKARDEVNDAVEAWLGVRVLPEEGTLIERARAGPYEVVLAGGKCFVILEGHDLEEPMPTLRALMAAKPDVRWVTVDMGAVPFLRNGADVMSPGITEAHEDVQAGNLVWVRDEEHGMPLALGKALMSGPEMAGADKGKAIEVLHYVGDELWDIGAS